MANVEIFLTSGTTWAVPMDFDASKPNSVECIGGGSGCGQAPGGADRYNAAGGGGAYSKQVNVAFTPGATVAIAVGDGSGSSVAGTPSAPGGDTWIAINNTATDITSPGVICGAKGASGAVPIMIADGNGTQGGQASAGVGSILFSGGNGATFVAAITGGRQGGGGGAGGPFGDGGHGGTNDPTGTQLAAWGGGGGGGGGGGNGQDGSSGGMIGGTGGNNHLGAGGGVGGTVGPDRAIGLGTDGTAGGGGGGSGNIAASNGTTGGAGTEWGTAGSGGGGGAAGDGTFDGGNPGPGGLYGGGAGAATESFTANPGQGAGQGIIRIVYRTIVAILSIDDVRVTSLLTESPCTSVQFDPIFAAVGPSLGLRWSDTRGATFGNAVPQDFGSDPLVQPQWNRTGYARGRVFELFWTAALKTALNGAFVEVVPWDS